MAETRSRRGQALLFAVMVAVAAAVIVGASFALRAAGGAGDAGGAAGPAGGAASASPATVTQGGASQAGASPAASPTAARQLCASCWGDGGPDPTVDGTAEVVDGVQIVRVGLEDGYYVPNEFTVQAGMPVRVVFSGSAKGCLAEPEFPDLGLKGDLGSGTATFELGTLAPGKYAFTCSMGVNEGHVTVE